MPTTSTQTNELPVVARHYQRIAELIRRDFREGSASFPATRAHLAPFALEASPGRPEMPKLIPTADGTISRMLLTIPAYAVESSALASVYQGLLSKLGTNVRLVVLTHERTQNPVNDWLKKTRPAGSFEVVTAPDHLHFSIWAEDGYVVAKDQASGRTFFVEPFDFPRYGDGLIADYVAHGTDLEQTQAPLHFQGGNVLIGDDFFLIGADYPAKSLQYIGGILMPPQGESRVELIRRLYKDYMDKGRKLLYVASTLPVPKEEARKISVAGESWTEFLYLGNKEGTAQPLFHIDMFLTLAGRATGTGKYRILVGDPKMAADLLGQTLPAHAMKPIFDNIASSLSKQGFDVVRNPLPLVYVDDPASRERLWYFATANNALVQSTGATSNKVYLPTYGHGEFSALKKVDKRNKEIWESMGFQVEELGDFHPFAENLGAVHCIKKYLSRG